jgi:tRNA A37 threonylcarbamoyladenosine synthetase subunit TsaC/SUA5/YrdC
MDPKLVYLTQTDTTAGFLSSDDKSLSLKKQRDPNQKTLQVVESFSTLKKKTRVPNRFKKLIRNSKKTTFIYKSGQSFRVVDKNTKHHNFLQKFGCLYSTSANKTKEKFDMEFAFANSDVIVYNEPLFKEKIGSSIYKINNSAIKKIR